MRLLNKHYIKESIKALLRSSFFVRKYEKKVRILYSMSKEELKIRNEKKFIELFRHSFKHSPFYNKLYKQHNISLDSIRCLDDINKLPIIDKSIIRNNVKDIKTSSGKRLLKTNTSGTTGSPLVVFRSFESIWLEQAYLNVFKERRGVTKNSKTLIIRGNLNREMMGLHLKHFNLYFLSSFQISDANINHYYQAIKNFKPTVIEGYPSSIYNLCLKFKELNLSYHIPVCFTSSETLLESHRDLISEVLGSTIYDYYGTTERTIAFAECLDHRGYFNMPGYSLVEMRDDSAITTSLINNNFPLIRYRVDDIFEKSIKPLFKDQELDTVLRIVGRVEDNVICKDGATIGRLDILFKGIEGVKHAQIIQTEIGILTINIVPLNNFLHKDSSYYMSRLNKNIESLIGKENMNIKIRIITDAEIIYTTRGKFKFVISNI